LLKPPDTPDGRLRVLFVNAGTVVGGAEHSLLLLLAALRKADVHTHVALLEDGPFRERLSALGISQTVVSLPDLVRRAGRYDVRGSAVQRAALVAMGIPAAWRLARLARQYRADVIHTNGMKSHLLGGLAGRIAGVPVVWHVRDFPPPGWAGRVFRAQARLLPSTVLTNSEAVRSAFAPRGRAGVPVVVLHNPVDLDDFHPRTRGSIRRELGLGEDTPLVGMIAHLTPWKGHEVFLNAARRIAAAVPAARFVVVGGARYETNGHAGYLQSLVTHAAALGLDKRLTLTGDRDDVAAVLADLDVLVHCPTSPEPFGRVVAEAMAAGRPVVASRCGGIPELIEDGVNGLLVAPGDDAAVAAATVQLLNDRELRCRLGQAGRHRAESQFRLDAHAAAVLQSYQAL
jgi:glycosyltransferase involved in cell wall biosynthesis